MGKSDLALRLLDEGFSLVADDRTLLWTSGSRLFGRAPDSLSGLIEARGLGIIQAASRHYSSIDLVADCTDEPLERVPEPARANYLGHDLPLVRLVAREASAPAKLSRALMALG